jgi:plasmid stabilization system protein ParE
MNFQVAVSPRCRDDILRNALWWAENHSPEQALTWVNTVEQQFKELRTMPERFGLAPENPKCTRELRQQSVGLGDRRSYQAVFTIIDQSVFVLAVRRAAQDHELTDADVNEGTL